MLRGDDGAQPLEAGPRRPLHQVLLHLHRSMDWIMQHLMTPETPLEGRNAGINIRDHWKDATIKRDFISIAFLMAPVCLASSTIPLVPKVQDPPWFFLSSEGGSSALHAKSQRRHFSVSVLLFFFIYLFFTSVPSGFPVSDDEGTIP